MKNGLHIDKDGTKRWYLDGKCHRLDGPAVVWADGSESWYLHDKLHRLDGPAVVQPDGSSGWYLHDKLHRLDGPAVVRADGTESWYLDDMPLGEGAKGFWALWSRLTPKQQNNLNLHLWVAKYT